MQGRVAASAAVALLRSPRDSRLLLLLVLTRATLVLRSRSHSCPLDGTLCLERPVMSLVVRLEFQEKEMISDLRRFIAPTCYHDRPATGESAA